MIYIGWFSICSIIIVYLIAATGLFAGIDLNGLTSNLNQPYVLKVIKFSFLQASLSTFISIGLAVFVARALHRQHFRGKSLILLISGLSIVIPVIVAILGIVTVHGNSGWVNGLLNLANFKANYIYGLAGILIAHVFFNLPLATRILLISLTSIPAPSWRLVNHLGMNSWQIFRFLEWPLIRTQLPQLAGLIFLLCFTSFAIVLVFGGGLKYSTLEVAIYQALRFDFDLSKAVVLAVIQIIICALVFFLIVKGSSEFSLQNLSVKKVLREDGRSKSSIILDAIVLSIFVIWVLLPIAAILFNGSDISAWSVIKTDSFLNAVKGSVFVSITSATLAALMVLSICYVYKSVYQSGSKTSLIDLLVQLILIFPAFVLATGLFIMIKTNITFNGPIIVIIVNVLAIVPFMMRILLPSILFTQRYDRLSASLGLISFNRLVKIDWPIIRQAFSLAVGIGLALSIGDFSVIALFGSQDFQTLPLYLYRLMGAYRTEQAGIVAIVICITCVVAFYVSQRLIGDKNVKA